MPSTVGACPERPGRTGSPGPGPSGTAATPTPVPEPRGPLQGRIADRVGTCTEAPPPPSAPTAVQRLSDIAYAPKAGGRSRHLDLYLPGGETTDGGPRPILVLFHGGSWSSRDEEGLEDRARHLAAHGLAVAAVRYRLASGMQPARFPAQASDARCAVRVLRKTLAPRHHLDPGRILAGGFSAGGHLAALLALADGPEAVAALDDGSCPDGTTSPAVQGAFGWYAPLDLRRDAPAGATSESN